MSDYALTIISSVAASGLLSLTLVWLLRHWIATRLRASIEHEYARKLESYKAALQAEHNVAIERLRSENAAVYAVKATATNSFLNIHNAAHGRRLRAIEITWRAMLTLHDEVLTPMFLLDCLKREEFSEGVKNPLAKQIMDKVTIDEMGVLIQKMQGAEDVRPFAGEYLYSLFFAYRSLVYRVLLLVQDGQKSGVLPVWYENRDIRTFLATVMSQDELAQFDKLQVGKYLYASDVLRQKMLRHMADIISGKASADFGFEQARKIEQAASVLASRHPMSESSR